MRLTHERMPARGGRQKVFRRGKLTAAELGGRINFASTSNRRYVMMNYANRRRHPTPFGDAGPFRQARQKPVGDAALRRRETLRS